MLFRSSGRGDVREHVGIAARIEEWQMLAVEVAIQLHGIDGLQQHERGNGRKGESILFLTGQLGQPESPRILLAPKAFTIIKLVGPSLARVAKSADATDLKSVFPKGECGFKSHPGHQSAPLC